MLKAGKKVISSRRFLLPKGVLEKRGVRINKKRRKGGGQRAVSTHREGAENEVRVHRRRDASNHGGAHTFKN